MFIVIVTYKKPLEEVERYLAAHRAHLDRHFATGDLLMTGPQTPRCGGVIIVEGHSRKKAEAIIAADPFNIHGIADYRIIEFTPTKFSSEELRLLLQ